jgi:hypothetical protein
LKRDLIAAQLMRQAALLGRFLQSRPEVPVNRDRTTDQAIREFVEFPLRDLRIFVIISLRREKVVHCSARRDKTAEY